MQTLFFPKLFSIINHNNAIKDIQTLLKSPEKSIKEIVNELEFPSLSFFGRYIQKQRLFNYNQLPDVPNTK